ncbi:MAG: hypothetical protein OEX18_05790 [Candidatus Krumholzibacteria bacterium]|nr:hypothetical protein [Candidatus Krumholzibacteria bacterium]MDH4336774.1 hypothetical protein [Candidatus Krumholzibacteria bacterium]MDH5269459.1 hypothetical protein [Candidatus Krumholzibacteria bacterium]
MVLRRLLLVLMMMVLPACSTERSDDEFFAPGGAGVPVIDATMVVGKPFPNVYVTETLLPNQPFSYEAAGINGARVVIEWGSRIRMPYINETHGLYVPMFPDSLVHSDVIYGLTVTLPDNRVVKATTTTPGALRVREWVLLDDAGQTVQDTLRTFDEFPSNPDTLYTLNQLTFSKGLLEVRLENDPAQGYLVGLESLDLDSPLLVDTSFLDDEDVDNFTRQNQSPPFAPTQAYLRAPWFAIYYEGRYKVRVFKMDRNWYDLARTDPVLGQGGFGFGGEAGDNTVPPLFHVDGGVGLFGSLASDSIGFYVNAP